MTQFDECWSDPPGGPYSWMPIQRAFEEFIWNANQYLYILPILSIIFISIVYFYSRKLNDTTVIVALFLPGSLVGFVTFFVACLVWFEYRYDEYNVLLHFPRGVPGQRHLEVFSDFLVIPITYIADSVEHPQIIISPTFLVGGLYLKRRQFIKFKCNKDITKLSPIAILVSIPLFISAFFIPTCD